MSEEVQAVETNPLNDMIQHALDQNFNKANELFNDMISVKMADVLDQEKARLADEIYNGAEPEEEQLELDLEDEEGAMDETEASDAEEEEEEGVQEPRGDVDEPMGDEDSEGEEG